MKMNNKKPKFQVLCVTMGQNDFSKIDQMNIKSDVIFANQANYTGFSEHENNGHIAKMISTATRGVGINRNISLMYADADICLLADDDMHYIDNLEDVVVNEFVTHPDADIFIFNVNTNKDTSRPQKRYDFTRKCHKFERMPWGGVRVAFKLNSIKKANIWFTSLFGGGCIFSSGEDSIWLVEAKRKGLTFYVSKETIGEVSFEQSSWYTGRDESFYYARGAYNQAIHKRSFLLWSLYIAFRTKTNSKVPFIQRIKWMYKGKKGFNNLQPYGHPRNETYNWRLNNE